MFDAKEKGDALDRTRSHNETRVNLPKEKNQIERRVQRKNLEWCI